MVSWLIIGARALTGNCHRCFNQQQAALPTALLNSCTVANALCSAVANVGKSILALWPSLGSFARHPFFQQFE